MKRIGLFLLAVVMVVGLAGCSKDDKDYNFNGTWLIQWQVVSQIGNVQFPTGRVLLVQSGNDLTWTYLDGGGTIQGTCDPGNKSLYIRYGTSTGGEVIMNGLGEDSDTITGTASGNQGSIMVTANFTLELISR